MSEIKANSAMLVIIDYGMGNLRSVYNKFKRIGIPCTVSSDITEIAKADKLVLPGVGHFGYGIQKLNELGFVSLLNKKVVDEQTPILGICLGTQLFCKYSEEGNCTGLGWIDAEVVRFNVKDKIKYKVPHMGWNDVVIINSNIVDDGMAKKRSNGPSPSDQYYFVHSYHIKCNNPADVWMVSNYECEFVSAIRRNNIFGTQFHPEKSHDVGYELIKVFSEI